MSVDRTMNAIQNLKRVAKEISLKRKHKKQIKRIASYTILIVAALWISFFVGYRAGSTTKSPQAQGQR